ncbi:MAG: DNA recombination protein RmuC [Acidimicrobiia bacterium]
MSGTAVVIGVVTLLVGLGGGAAIALVVAKRGQQGHAQLAEELRAAAETQRQLIEASRDQTLQAALEQLVTANRAIAEQQAKVGEAALGGKTVLIDQQLRAMQQQLAGELQKVTGLVSELEKDRQLKFGRLAEALDQQNQQLVSLSGTAQSLREVLASQKVRGQWGERMAEDVLHVAGLIENVNYRKQKALDDRSGIPDYTFLLPHDMVVHMDVKFPLDNYVRYLEAEDELARKRFRDDFLRDVRAKIKELAKREYEAGPDSLDCVLLFIPNEALYAFIHEEDRELLEEGMRHRIVLCSPATLFAVLAVIRQAADTFRLERASSEILELLATFKQQWGKYCEQMEKLGQRIDQTSKEYQTLVGTRANMLERPLNKIAALEAATLDVLDATDDDSSAFGVAGEQPLTLDA